MDFFTDTKSRWIGLTSPNATYFRHEFMIEPDQLHGAKCAICAAGYYLLYLNGKKVGDHVLDPIVSIYDKHVRYCIYDVTPYIHVGINAVGVVLGNGWYNCPISGKDAWWFATAPWMGTPRFRFELRDAFGNLTEGSTPVWKATAKGPIRYNSFRSGETYDARLELGDWTLPNYDETLWEQSGLLKSPGGIPEEQTAVPIKVLDVIPMKFSGPFRVYDAGVNIAGHVRMTVQGNPGDMLTLDYTERVTEDNEPTTWRQCGLAGDPRSQQDQYTLRGGGPETFETSFAYHGFRWVRVSGPKGVKILNMDAVVVGTSFEQNGSFECSSPILNQLQEMTLRSYHSNFVGIPTDCPHREKNGWTGDAQLASDTGLYNFKSAASYRQWLATIRDCQRPNGDLPGIVPTGGWGYNWGDGPGWDCVIFVIPFNVWLHTGDDTVLKENYEAMKKYLALEETMQLDHIIQFGLGDWCSPEDCETADFKLSVTGCYYNCLQIMVQTAKHFGYDEDAVKYDKVREEVRQAFNRTFYKGNGIYDNGSLCALGTALYFDLCDKEERPAVVQALVSKSRELNCKAMFGIMGAKYVPRVLAEEGYPDLALNYFLQEEYPGWVNWIKRGATTLWENWEGNCSRNHIMYGDLSAWFFRYLGGFRHTTARPGPQHLIIRPMPVKALTHAKTTYCGYVSDWTLANGQFTLKLTVPDGCQATLLLPDGTNMECVTGTTTATCQIPE